LNQTGGVTATLNFNGSSHDGAIEDSGQLSCGKLGPYSSLSGNPDDGTGSSPHPGCAAEGGSDASIDSSLPRSTFAFSSCGLRFTCSSNSLSGGSDRTGGGTWSFWSFTWLTPGESLHKLNERAPPPFLSGRANSARAFDGRHPRFCQSAYGNCRAASPRDR